MTRRCSNHWTQPSAPRGAALLIVLAALMVTMTAATILLSAATDVRLQRDLAQCEVIAQDMLAAAEGPIHHWLEMESQSVVLPADSAVPATAVLHDCLMVSRDGDDEAIVVELTITAFDQLGMVPAHLARSGSPLRLALPSEALACLDGADLPPLSDPIPLGLDLFAPLNETINIGVFPESMASPPLLFGAAPPQASDEPESPPRTPPHPNASALGALVATHNSPQIRININTAPMRVVEAALRSAGRGGLEQIIAARSKDPPHPSTPQSAGGATEDSRPQPEASDIASHIPQIVTSSDCWAFRIEVCVGVGVGVRAGGHVGGLLRRSWWAIYMPGPDDPNTPPRETWRCLQRLPVTR